MSSRFDKLKRSLSGTDFSAIVLNPGPTLTYLTGLEFHLSERPTILLYSLDTDKSVIILPNLEVGKLQEHKLPIIPFPYGDQPKEWINSFKDAVSFIGLGRSVIGVEANHIRFLELQYLQQALPESKFTSADHLLSQLRIKKSPDEILYMKRAVQIAETALHATLKKIKIGMSEREIASELTLQLLMAGSDPALPFYPIVAGGPNTANPHSVPGLRMIQPGDLLLFDFGASFSGYCSDITRIFFIGEPRPEFKKIYEIVKEANNVARQIIKPGIPAGEIDLAARELIHHAGYGDYFIHRSGHGLGLEIHEPPYIFNDNPLLLEEGMTFTIEPGIYIPNQGGIRIEDNVVVTDNGASTLTNFSRELTIID